ncbi:MAG TPA: CCA tRNA nucleotidyltransferase [Nitrososphaera sp.]|nr:CCA tRNA nucleotidyltransferase [Nitrososphaera sp.]
MPDHSTLISKLLPICEPTHSEESKIARIAQEAKAHVDSYVARLEDVVEVVFGGSFAKGTWLPHHADIDIFVKIRPSVGIVKFEKMGVEIGTRALKNYGPKLRYSEHPYVEVFVKEVRVNIVPCYDVEQGRWRSAADRSPFHTQYINSHFDKEKRTQARLLKKFLKIVGIYGAEISTEGFSGYVSEVLVLKYSSFENILRAAADWKERQIIAVSEYDSDFVKASTSPLVIIDPIDRRRNLGAAISPQSMAKFMLAARAFLEKPSFEFLKENVRYQSEARKLLSDVLVIEFSHQNKSPDIIWGQLKRSANAITKQLELAHFEVLRSSCITDERNSAVLAFLLESVTLPPYIKKRGPEVFRRNDTSSFLSMSKKKPLAIWVDREMRIVMLIERKAADARKFVRTLLLSQHENSGIARDLIASKLQIYSGADRKIIKGLAREAIGSVISTERLIFR